MCSGRGRPRALDAACACAIRRAAQQGPPQPARPWSRCSQKKALSHEFSRAPTSCSGRRGLVCRLPAGLDLASMWALLRGWRATTPVCRYLHVIQQITALRLPSAVNARGCSRRQGPVPRTLLEGSLVRPASGPVMIPHHACIRPACKTSQPVQSRLGRMVSTLPHGVCARGLPRDASAST